MTNTKATHPTARMFFTDGSSHGNPGKSGWANVEALPDGTLVERSGHLPHATNNIAELSAIKDVIMRTPEGTGVHIVSDSMYCIQALTDWLPNKWKGNGFRTAKGKPIENRDLILEIDALMQPREITFEHVKAHSGHPANERADALANNAALCMEIGQ
ncbi:MAG: ribonuclease HI [Cognatishimia sp.]|uniref:ribonuclease H family protein n=1 Tax=Cognatishimia sp. TaxID=2211648 RepID=UPI003B8E2E9F